MRQVRLISHPSTWEGTFGVLVFGEHWTYTLELPWLDNKQMLSCIPGGDYRVVPRSSQRFGRHLHVTNVPGRGAILFHPANFGGALTHGYDTNLQGCIAPFLRHGYLRNSKDRMQRAGCVSRPAFSRLMAWADNKPFNLRIERAS
jgi:hypothetical protein